MSTTRGNDNVSPFLNPLRPTFESFVKETPLVTRYTMMTLVMSYILSFCFNPQYALANVPIFTINRCELYRLVLAPFVCTNSLSLIFGCMCLHSVGRRLEFVMGSTNFALLLLMIGSLTNLLFVTLCIMSYFFSGNVTWLLHTSVGMWTVLLGIIAVERSNCPEGSIHILVVVEVPGVYYPLLLLALFTLLSGLNFAHCISVVLGYAHGLGYFDRLILYSPKKRRWEDAISSYLAPRDGWLVSPIGSNWNMGIALRNLEDSKQPWNLNVFSPFNTYDEGGDTIRGLYASENVNKQRNTKNPTSVGKTHVDRVEVLKAAERRVLGSDMGTEPDEEKG